MYRVLRYAEDAVFVLIKMRNRVILEVDRHLHTVVILIVGVHRHVAIVFYNLVCLVCVEGVIFIVYVDVLFVVGLAWICDCHCMGFQRRASMQRAILRENNTVVSGPDLGWM